jgi:hypothetical protein
MIHIGVDLYIILLSGQRFISDKDRIQAGVLELLEKNNQ